MTEAAALGAVGPDTIEAVGNERPPLFIRLARGVPGEELEQYGYKVTLLPRKARVAKEKAAPKKRKRLTAAQRRKKRREYSRRWEEKFAARFGIEALRTKWREERRRQRAAKKALVGYPTTQATDGLPATDAGQRPTFTEG